MPKITTKTRKDEIMQAMLSCICPFCEGRKLRGCMFCDSCYKKLPVPVEKKIRNALRCLSEGLFEGIKFLEG